jgi:hypothetical protein
VTYVSSLALALVVGTSIVVAPTPTPTCASPARPLPPAVAEPTPPVSSSDFVIEPTGRAPVDNDGLIPNPLTPTGARIGPPKACTVTFASAHGTTSATVNSWVSGHQDSIRAATVVCLAGVFTSPLHIWDKTSTALLELGPAPGAHATLDLGVANGGDVNSNEYWSGAGGLSIVDSRSVEIYGLTVENYTFAGEAQTPAGIYVTARSDTEVTNQAATPHLSACYWHGGSCGDIFIIGDTVRDITNTADQYPATKSACGDPDVDAYGIAVTGGGSHSSQELQHVVVEDDTVLGTRTGQSETVSFDGAVRDFLVAGNVIGNADNIGIDTTGWETGGAQANHGLVYDNTVYNVDTLTNAGYGQWDGRARRCLPTGEGAAGIYDDGATYIWVKDNTVWDSDQGINLDVETAGKTTSHLLVSGNFVRDSPGTSQGDPSYGPGSPGSVGESTVAGHDVYAMYIDAFGTGAAISDVYVVDNVFQNESQHYLTPQDGMPVVDIAGQWSGVDIWHNTIEGMGPADRYNPLLEVDQQPQSGSSDVIDCNDYGDLSTSASTVNGNFALPSTSFMTLAAWQSGNGYGWDAHSGVGHFSPACPAPSL